MNFKFNLWKGITSIIGGIILGYIINSIINYYTYLGKEEGYIASMPLGTIFLFFIVPIILIYIIWSLIQKKK